MYPETKQMLDDQIVKNLSRLAELPAVTLDSEGNTIYDPERKALEKETLDLIDKLEMAEKSDIDVMRFQEEQRIKEEDLKRKYELDQERFQYEQYWRQIEWQNQQYAQYQKNYYEQGQNRIKNAIDVGSKILVPVATTLFAASVYFGAQHNVFDFEEHGRITSSPGRDLKLPKLSKLW